jgi:hypothetical protein
MEYCYPRNGRIFSLLSSSCAQFWLERTNAGTSPRNLFEQARQIKATIDPKLGTELTLLAQTSASDLQTSAANGETPTSEVVLVDIAFSTPLNNDAVASVLGTVSGLEVINCHGLVCSVQLPISELTALTQIDAVQFARHATSLSDSGLDASKK